MSPPLAHVIVDRDGVLNVEGRSGRYVLDPAEFVWIEGAVPALLHLRRLGLRLSVVTNQSCVGRGLLTPAGLERIHERMRRDCSGAIEAVFACVHAPDEGCACRKPRPALLHRAMAWSGVEAAATVFVGDAATDVGAARSAGIAPVLVRTGKGRRTEQEALGPLAVYDDLWAFARSISSGEDYPGG